MSGERQNSQEEINSPEAERERKIADLFEQGLDSPDIMAYHGTSLEAINELIKTGKLPSGKTDGGIGYLYFFRLDHPVPKEWLNGETEQENIMGGAKMYAKDLAHETSMCRILGLDINQDHDFLSAMERIFWQYQNRINVGRSSELEEKYLRENDENDILAKYIDQYGFPAIKAAFDESFQRQGIIIGINQKILAHDVQSAYEELNDEGWRANLPDGLPLEYISGLEPVGQPEYEYFEALQEKYSE